MKRVHSLQFIVHRSQLIIYSILFFLSSVFCLLSSVCYAESISSTELIENARLYDGKEVTFQGEVIGDIMKRGNFSWVNISDEKNAVGVFLENSIGSNIIFTGDYDHRGDMVEVKGIFHRACRQHGGDLDIHADKITKLTNGYKVIHRADQKKVKAALWLMAILFCLTVVAIIKMQKDEKTQDKVI